MSTDVQNGRGQVRVGVQSFHHKAYKYWQRYGNSKPSGYRENLCHYMRVVLIWVPLLWFFKVPVRKRDNSWLRPWMIPVTMGVLGAIAWLSYLWPHMTLVVFLSVVGVLVGLAILFGIIWLFEESETVQDMALLVLVGITAPLWGPIYLLVMAGKWIGNKFIVPYGPGVARWFFKRSYLKVIYPWVVAVLAGLAAVYLFAGLKIFLWVLAGAGILVAGVAILAGVVLGLYWLFSADEFDLPGRLAEWLRKLDAWLGARVEPKPVQQVHEEKPVVLVKPQPKPQRGTSIFKVIWQYVVAKKHKVCPFIILPEDGSNNGQSTGGSTSRPVADVSLPPSEKWWGPIGR